MPSVVHVTAPRNSRWFGTRTTAPSTSTTAFGEIISSLNHSNTVNRGSTDMTLVTPSLPSA